MKQKLIPVLLPTSKKPYPIEKWGKWLFNTSDGKYSNRDPEPIGQHLYLCSTEGESPKGASYIIYGDVEGEDYRGVRQMQSDSDWRNYTYTKIIASTDKSLNLPSIDSKSIELYVKHQPKEVYVEMEYEGRNNNTAAARLLLGIQRVITKVSTSNEVSFSLVEESWDDIIKEYANIMKVEYGFNTPTFSQYLKENYQPPKKL